MHRDRGARRLVAMILSWVLVLPVMSVPAADAGGSKYVEVRAGQPAVWSLGQAHYLIANMHNRNRELTTKMPDENALDPNRINASRLEALRTILQLEAQFDEPLGAKNELEMERFADDRDRQETAAEELKARRVELADVDRELLAFNEELAVLKEKDRQSTETRAAQKPPAPPTDEDNERKLKIVSLTARADQKTKEKARLESEITALSTTAGTAPTAPNLQGAALTAGRSSLPSSPAFDAFLTKAINDFGQPSLAATTTLDNFVGMQYEIIAKQLTLLRDEVGPDERVIFLELPVSIYTVDQRADDYLAQVEWTVTEYYRDTFTNDELQKTVCEQRDGASAYEALRCLPSELGPGEIEGERQYDPVTLEMIKTHTPVPVEESFASSASWFKVRALDVIPRQSALNVNEHHAMVKNVGILGFFKWLSGVGAKLDYQRQREAYEQFVYQDVFASGFGKGSNTFGWTFGPLPGTRRLAPGQRTTFAVLAVPRDTLALEITATNKVFRRNRRPPQEEPQLRMVVSVPGPKTESFVVEHINYAPVLKGRRTTAVLRGNHLSPQLGVLVNGVPLKRALSIARTGSKEDYPAPPGSGVQGEFEITNSRQMVLSFSMGSDFVGTPIITLVTPEKSLSINFTRMIINDRADKLRALQVQSSWEPMFIDELSLTSKVEKIGTRKGKKIEEDGTEKEVPFVIARLQGKGFRHDADVWLNKTEIPDLRDDQGKLVRFPSLQQLEESYRKGRPFAVQESTGSYILFAENPGDDWAIRYRQRTRQGFEESSFEQSFAAKPVVVRNYRRGSRGEPAEVLLTLTNKAKIQGIALIDPPPGGACSFQDRVESEKRLARCVVPRDRGGERGLITVRLDLASGDPHFEDIALPIRPGVATVTNPATGNASGLASQPMFAAIRGESLQNVKAVFFGDAEAAIQSSGDFDVLWVKVPKVDNVAKGQSVVVPVLFQTRTDGDTKLPSGAFYTYLGEPVPAEVVVWPCTGPGPCVQATAGGPGTKP